MKLQYAESRLPVFMALALALLVYFLFIPSAKFDFFSIDDHEHVIANKMVTNGLTPEGIRQAFLDPPARMMWGPLFWLTFMADYEFYGLDPGGFHRTNVIFHVVNSLLFFAFIYRATGSPWKSLFASALWALHPMRVESVAWITERKDLVSGMFFLLCLLSYVQFAKEKKPFWFAAALLMMLLGYGAKPILVIVPVILLLVDFWPLGRFGREGERIKRLLLEKIPFALLSITLSLLTIFLMSDLIPENSAVPAGTRLVYVVTSVTYHLVKAVWPFHLVMRDYPATNMYTGVWLFAALLMFSIISFIAWRAKDAVPAMLAGWLWYLTAIFPVSGITPFGSFLVADHFTYLPHMGICLLGVWGIEYFVKWNQGLRKASAVAALFLIGAMAFQTSGNLAYWKDGLTFFTRQVELEENTFTLKELGIATAMAKRPGEAVKYFEKALALNPRDPDNYYNLALALLESGEGESASLYFEKTIRMAPDRPDARHVYAGWLRSSGRIPEAVMQYEELLRINPDDRRAQKALGELAR